MEEENKKKFTFTGIKLSHIRDLIIIVLLAVFTWKLAFANININLTDFKFTDFLSLFLALFAVGLSAAFYFKANETSNKFYNNMYRFTSDMSQMLGRIEVGFGERLKHLDDSYVNVNNKFDSLMKQRIETIQQFDKEEEDYKKTLIEKDKLIEELVQKSNLNAEEKIKIKEDIEKKDNEIENARIELSRLKTQLNKAETYLSNHFNISVSSKNDEMGFGELSKYLHYFPSELILNEDLEGLNKIIKDVILKPQKITALKFINYQVLNERGELTNKGLEFLKVLNDMRYNDNRQKNYFKYLSSKIG